MSGQRDTIFEIAKNMKIDLDEGQKSISENLDKLAIDLEQKSKKFSFLFFNKSNEFKGLYIYGGVGRGKSMLMDLFFQNVEYKYKKRTHFHNFMSEAHDLIHELRKDSNIENIPDYAAEIISKETKLLCFDEMELRDIADAMVLHRLFTGLWNRGVIIVATSNRPPKMLYDKGLHRDRVIPVSYTHLTLPTKRIV